MKHQATVNLLLVKVGTEEGLEAIPRRIKDIDSRIRTFGVLNQPGQKHQFDEVVTSSWEATLGAHPEYLDKGLYVRPELFKTLHHKEGQLLRMLERVAIHDLTTVAQPTPPIPSFKDSVDDRSQLLLRQIAYWDHVCETKKISAVVAQNYGHNGWDAALQAVIEARGIPYLFFHEVRPFLGSLYMHESVSELGDLSLGLRLKEFAGSRQWLQESPSSHREHLFQQIGISKAQDKSAPVAPPTPLLRVIINRIGNPVTVPLRLLRSWRRRVRNRKSIIDERRAITTSALPDNYLFCELQSQPNATTAVKGWIFPDQRESVAFTAAHLPSGWGLVVKESDRQWARMYPRRRNFWTQIAQVPNVYVVDSRTDAWSLVKDSRGVVETGYSTLAQKALTSGVPVIIFGHTHIGELSGVTVVEDSKSMSEAMAMLSTLDKGCRDQSEILQSLEQFVLRTEEATLEGALSSMPKFGDAASRDAYVGRLTSNVAGVVCAWLHARGVLTD